MGLTNNVVKAFLKREMLLLPVIIQEIMKKRLARPEKLKRSIISAVETV